ncbi:MAG: sulfite exporter TauE/SafE family protein [Bacteroidetes bacterium]|nr:sulfite exporter TauE/SafE family protein [Bacteroidota bacterium]
MEVFGYICAVLIGISLGLIGGGGSILTVPVLVYLFNIEATLATSYSLFIVGSSSLVGAYKNYQKGWVSVKTALLFGLSSITTVFIIRKIVVPKIPAIIWQTDNVTITKDTLTMVCFAILMLLASISMIRNKQSEDQNTVADKNISIMKLLIYGIGIGTVTGFLGAGGGFLIIPALVLLVKLPMKEAIGTSLLIIALNSLIGFTGDIGHFDTDWVFLAKITAIAIAGIFVGGQIGKSISGAKLKKGFGWFVLLMGTWVIVKELFLK